MGTPMTAQEVCEVLRDAINDGLLDELLVGFQASTFDDVGMLTMNKGLVLHGPEGEDFRMEIGGSW